HIKHQNRIVHSQSVGCRVGNVFDGSNHVVSKITNGASGKWRQIRKRDGSETLERGSQCRHKIRWLTFGVAAYEKRIASQKGIPAEGGSAFHAFQQESILPVLFQFEICRNRS